ncbi:MAG: hypothetical protein V3575_06235 [Candidatus Absconditabacteria bacterium]
MKLSNGKNDKSSKNFQNMLIENIEQICTDENEKIILFQILKYNSFVVDGVNQKDLLKKYINCENLKGLIDEDLDLLIEEYTNLLKKNYINEMVESYKVKLIEECFNEQNPGDIVQVGNKKYIIIQDGSLATINEQNNYNKKILYICEDKNGFDIIVDGRGKVIFQTSCDEQTVNFLNEYIVYRACNDEIHFFDKNLYTVFHGATGSILDVVYLNGTTYLASRDHEKLENPNYFRGYKITNYKLFDLEGNIIFSSNEIWKAEKIIKFNNGNSFVIGTDNNFNKYFYNMNGDKISETMHVGDEIFEFENPFDQEKYYLISNLSNGYLFSSDGKSKTISSRIHGKTFGEEVYFDKKGNMYFEINSLTETGTIIDVNGKKKSIFTKLINTVKLQKI